ncbi:MAG: GH116 family glycosyl hydrolase [Verrucomicrobiota bacterium]
MNCLRILPLALLGIFSAPGSAESASQFKQLPTSKWSEVIPADKTLSPEWERSLFERGAPRTYTGEALMNIGMPVGGITTGALVYLGGDGKLWNWDIFNRPLNGVMPRMIQYKDRSWHQRPKGIEVWQGGNYIDPIRDQPSPFEQGFALKVIADGKEQIRTLDRRGWKNIVFTGAYPFGTVSYSDPDCPVEVILDAYSPFVPLDYDDSSYPATIMSYRVENTSSNKVEVEVGGWLENPVLIDTIGAYPGVLRTNAVVVADKLTMLVSKAVDPTGGKLERPDIVFEDFEKPTYEGWKVEGSAFGAAPVANKDVPAHVGETAMQGERTVNSHASAPGDTSVPPDPAKDSARRDSAMGKLTSKPFTIERNFITFLIGGGGNPETAVRLLVDGQVVQTASGPNSSAMREAKWDVTSLAGKTAQLEVIDQSDSAVWGHIGADNIAFRDMVTPLEKQRDWGSMALAAIGAGRGSAQLSPPPHESVFAASGPASASSPASHPLIGGVAQSLSLAPGGSGTMPFVIAWYFANTIETVKGAETGHGYGKRFKDAAEVAADIAANATRLDELTRLWNTTWYDSTLPYWFLERAMIPLDSLASPTCYRFADGRFYTYEGIRSCAGHPNHVWHYAQAHARLFPELEQDVIERVWYGFGFKPDGSMAYRGEVGGDSAIDGHCGVILAVLRAHQTNPDAQMLKRLWPRVKKSIEYANTRDRDADGLLDTPMLTTLDEPWHGVIPWTSSLYIAALKAGEQMALEMGDAEFAADCHQRAEKGRAAMDAKLFNGQWFVQIPDPENPKKLGAYETVHIDQVMGQGWAWQLGLGRVLNEDTTRSALRSIWKYNFARSLDAYDAQADPKGRPYCADGEGGMVMTANALGRETPFGVYSGFACYLNETMNGFEYQAAAHMIAEGMVKEGLAVMKTIDERYDGNKRNPFNEVECGDHYARSMASYGALIAISGFEYHGPKRHIGFAPRITPDNFKAPFTTAEGWGSYSQKISGGTLRAELSVKHGKVPLRNMSLVSPKGEAPLKVSASLDGNPVPVTLVSQTEKVEVVFDPEIAIAEGQSLEVVLLRGQN